MNLLKTPFCCALAAVPMAMAPSASALLIDDFSVEQLVADDAVAGVDSANSVLGGMLGGERDMQAVNGTGSLGTTGVSDGVLNFSNSPTSQGTLYVDYDGGDNSSVQDLDGLGGIDLTDGGTSDGFIFTLLFSDFAVDYFIAVVDMDGDQAFLTVALPTGVNSAVDIFTPFADFTGSPNPVDFNNIGIVILEFRAQALAADITIDNFRTGVVPEPTSVALLLAGGALLARRRRRA